MSDMERSFRGVWIPKEIWLTDKLTPIEKMFLIEIDSLDNKEGCFASNAHFSKLFHRAKNTCSEIINTLEKKGYLSIKLEREGKVISKRILRVKGIRKTEHPYSGNRETPIRKTEHPYSGNRETPIRKTEHPYSENREGNNTNINNTNRESNRPLDFLKNNFPIRYEQEFLMRYKSEIKDFKKFAEDFNDKVDFEGAEYSQKLIYRLNSFARNWIANQNKFSSNQEEPKQESSKPVYLRRIT